jgi:glycosyltransferase involved in cell wall biosynthesis/ribosomal protein S18 acetylase RimI-like enzyme
MLANKGTSPARLLHIVGESRFGGVARIILGLGRVAQAEGWQVDVLTTDPQVQKAVLQHGLGLVNLDVIRREIQPLWDVWGLFRLYQYLRRKPYHIVHTHTSKGGFVGRLAARLARVPVIVHTAHGFAFHEKSPAAIRLVYSALERLASHWCDQIVSVSEFHRNWAIQLGICSPQQILAIPNGVVEATRYQKVELAQLRYQLGARPGDLLILTIARLAADKGLDYLIEAAAMLPATGRSTHIVIAGEGPEHEQLEQRARRLGVMHQVTFAGFREDVGDLLAACDAVILPSLREGLSISLLEAMAAGKPIIATNIGSQTEVASHGEIALLVPTADGPALAKAILRLIRDPVLMARLGENARVVYETFYTENRMLDAYRQLYVGLLHSKCPPIPTSRSRRITMPGKLSSEVISRGHFGFLVGHHRRNLQHVSPARTVAQFRSPQLTTPIAGRTNIVRTATEDDLTSIITIHQEAFTNFFLTRLGEDFLRKYYGLVLSYDLGIMLVSEGHESAVEGFACGFLDPPAFYHLMWCAWPTFAPPVLYALVRRPTLITKVLHGIQRIHSPAVQWPDRSCELSSIAVTPQTLGNGFGKELIRAFLAQAHSMDARCVYLTTDAEGNDAVNAFYRNVGFQHTRRFLQHEGRWMNEYVINGLEPGERWDPY